MLRGLVPGFIRVHVLHQAAQELASRPVRIRRENTSIPTYQPADDADPFEETA
jgi:hypothetical protein